ncbi:MAG TPA: hypothetical protein EYP56_17435 [Planctomycetaceae bacterium]|nr:hypothetical protein [Planctomycetaceae bacterium]
METRLPQANMEVPPMLSLQAAVLALALAAAPSDTVLLEFSAPWCKACRRMGPTLEALRARGYPVRQVDYDRQPQLAAKYRVRLLPTFVMLAEGKVVDRHEGLADVARLEQMFRRAGWSPGPRQPASLGPRAEPSAAAPLPRTSEPADPDLGPASPSPRQEPEQPSVAAVRGGQVVDVGGQPRVSEQTLVAASVRIRIEESDGHSWGTGTIIDARQGQALILTCGHIFRQSSGNGSITVDLFGPTPAKGLPGQLISYDVQRDIGLLVIRTPGPVVSARVAPPGYRVRPGDPVYTVGCSHGRSPTVRRTSISSLNRYLGPPNIEVAGLPVQGRSGGGLFSKEGLVIGVCNAADPAENQGLYAALESIHAQLDEARLAFVYQGEADEAAASSVAQGIPAMPKTMPAPRAPAEVASTSVGAATGDGSASGGLSPEAQAALEEILRRADEGAEVICIIRSRTDPTAPSEIITLNHVPPAFAEKLAAEATRRAAASRTRGTPSAARQIPRVVYPTQLSYPKPAQARRAGQPTGVSRRAGPEWVPQWLNLQPRAN